ncbi:MAG: RidA family protein [Aestuariivita sp.]|uniref:RidA family protein n=1 Tax=Aestuariivita sp. TaxID=1872407 RepID=UPI003BAEBABC
MRLSNPPTIAPPVGAYSHGVEIPPNARWLHVSGQVGIAPDGTLGEDAAEQSQIIWDNIQAILADAGMGIENLVKVTAFLTDPDDLPAYGTVRSAALGQARPCSTLIYVPALVKPDWKVEVDVVAAAAG